VTVIDRDSPVAFASRPALFGAEIKEPVLGYVIPLSSFTYPCKTDDHHAYEFNDYLHIPTPNLGCPRLCALGPRVPSRSEPWIALVQRGNCSFAAKAREAQSWGAKAIVVGGNDPDESGHPDTLVSMVDSGKTFQFVAFGYPLMW
jgi:E3 ubiquitin-protein ligase RNF13